MKAVIAPVKSVSRFSTIGEQLIVRSVQQPGIAVAFGASGAGKTTTVAWWATEHDAAYVRALSLWTPATMLSSICAEVGVRRRNSNAETMQLVARRLAEGERPKPLIIDEADHLLARHHGRCQLLDVLRDVHDISMAPLILVGMSDFVARLISLSDQRQFVGRISQWMEFEQADIKDARILADAVCEVGIEDDLLDRLHAEAGGSLRLLVVGLGQVEQFARNAGLKRVAKADAAKLALSLDKAPGLAERLRIRSVAAAKVA